MDVNGTRFHLLIGKKDWLRCQEEGATPGSFNCLDVDEQNEHLRLKPLLTLFSRRKNLKILQPSDRRGAATDRFGNIYWIAHDRQQLFWQPSGTQKAHVYWTQQQSLCTKPAAGEFQPISADSSHSELAGLAITEHHYLVVGSVSYSGLWVFDLHAGEEPLLIRFPENIPFKPFDITAAPGGGLWVLDNENRHYWGLDRNFKILSVTEPNPDTGTESNSNLPDFHAIDEVAISQPEYRSPTGFFIAASNPISIEALPDGSVLILDSPAAAQDTNLASRLYHYRKAQLLEPPIELKGQIETLVACAQASQTKTENIAVLAYDFAYDADTRTLYTVENTGKQVIAFSLSAQFDLGVKTLYLPMHSYGGRALIIGSESHKGKVFYDLVAGDSHQDLNRRWTVLHAIEEAHYAESAALLTPILDGKIHNCKWDVFFIDACIPKDTAIKISTRTDNDPNLITGALFLEEPALYWRGTDAEIAYYRPFADLTKPQDATGTWELLFQRAQGRYLQIRLELMGNSRTTPEIRALRAYYPRFSYVEQYLPTVYREDADSADFLERFLANPKVFLSDIEAKINDVSVLFDPRSAPSETIDWLASWLGIALDPLWESIHRPQSANSHSNGRPPLDRRRLFIRYAPRLYQQRGTPNGIRIALQLLLDPFLEEVLKRFVTAVQVLDSALSVELTNLNLPYPTPDITREALEELMFTYVLASHRASKVRIVERYMAREGRAFVAGDPTEAMNTIGKDTLENSAHRFSVLIAEGLPPEQMAMVDRIVDLEKPAHTAYEVKRFWDYFRVGEARLALDTVLGEESRFVPIILGRNTLAEGYLASAPPMDTLERRISDRDRLGDTIQL